MRGETKEALAWCGENRAALKKNPVCFIPSEATSYMLIFVQHNLEFELRLQQYIEMVRTRDPKKLLEATLHARKYLAPHMDTKAEEIHQAAGLLVYPPDTRAEPYKVSLHHTTPSNPHFRTNLITSYSLFTPQHAGPSSPTSTPSPTTASSPSPTDPSSTPPSQPASPPSKPPPATPPTPPHPPTPALPPPPSAPSAPPN